MRDIGKPTVIVHVLPGTPEEVVQNRENLRCVCEQICSEINGYPTKVTVCWDAAKGVYPTSDRVISVQTGEERRP